MFYTKYMTRHLWLPFSYLEQQLYFCFYYHIFLVFFVYFNISPMGNQANRSQFWCNKSLVLMFINFIITIFENGGEGVHYIWCQGPFVRCLILLLHNWRCNLQLRSFWLLSFWVIVAAIGNVTFTRCCWCRRPFLFHHMTMWFSSIPSAPPTALVSKCSLIHHILGGLLICLLPPLHGCWVHEMTTAKWSNVSKIQQRCN